MRARVLLPFLGLCLALSGCATLPVWSPAFQPSPAIPGTRPAAGFPLRIRVAIAVRQPSVHVAAPQSFVLTGFPIGKTREEDSGGERRRQAVLTADSLTGPAAFLRPLGGGEIRVNGRSYRGSMKIIEDQGGTLTVINELPLEDYVMGVLAGEVPRDWPLEALKAQAIAARTFAVLKRSESRRDGNPYDLENTALYQIYQGSDLVNDRIREAVSKTAGEILTYDSRPIEAYFHSNCGGRTCRAQDVWSRGEPYLQSVSCPFGDQGPHFRWTADLPAADVARKLRAAGFEASDVIGLKVLSRDESHRIRELAVMDGDGSWKRMKGSAFRMAVGPDVIRSTRFDSRFQGKKILFNGRGWGHGVGLCQEGACGMAERGYDAFEILRYYYRGVMMEKIKAEN